MRQQIEFIRRFLRGDTGAITVEYVVLAAAVTGVTLLSTDVLQVGMRGLAGTVDSELKGEAPDSNNTVSYHSGFDNGAQGWTGAGAAEVPGLGTVLGPIGGSNGEATVSRDFAFDEGTERAEFEFDLYAMDSLDNESGIIYIDGREVGRLTSDHGNTTFTVADGIDPDRFIVRQTNVDDQIDLGGSDRWTDGHSKIQITVRDPGTNVNFGFGSTANQGTSDESFSIDNFTVTSTAPRSAPAAPAADG